MLNQFKALIGYSENEINELWKNAIFVVDTNILLYFYKYKSKDNTDIILEILKNLKSKNRLWIPYQVALEYFSNHQKVIKEAKGDYNDLSNDISRNKEKVKEILNRFRDKYPNFLKEQFDVSIAEIKKTFEQLEEAIKSDGNNLHNLDEIMQDLLILLDGIIGNEYTQEEINEIEEEGNNRYKDKLPPGFKDNSKNRDNNGIRIYGGIHYNKKFGDLILWKQIINKVISEGTRRPIIFVTEDMKSDWWEKIDGINRPHHQLIQEFINETQQHFYMYDIKRFLEGAKKYLNVKISTDNINGVTKEISTINRYENNIINNSNRNSSKESYSFLKMDKLNLYRKYMNKIEKVEKYLDETETQLFQKNLTDFLNCDENLENTTFLFDQILISVVKRVKDKIEKSFNDFLKTTDTEQYFYYMKELTQFDLYSEGEIDRLILMVKFIDEMKRDLGIENF